MHEPHLVVCFSLPGILREKTSSLKVRGVAEASETQANALKLPPPPTVMCLGCSIPKRAALMRCCPTHRSCGKGILNMKKSDAQINIHPVVFAPLLCKLCSQLPQLHTACIDAPCEGRCIGMAAFQVTPWCNAARMHACTQVHQTTLGRSMQQQNRALSLVLL